MKSFVNKKIFIESNEYTYRVEHLTLEGTCSTDHGPRNVKIKNLLVDKYPVTNQQFSFFLKIFSLDGKTEGLRDTKIFKLVFSLWSLFIQYVTFTPLLFVLFSM